MDLKTFAERTGNLPSGYIFHAPGSFFRMVGSVPGATKVCAASDRPGETGSFAEATLSLHRAREVDSGNTSFKVGSVAVTAENDGRIIKLNGKSAHEHEYPYTDPCPRQG